MKCFNNDKVWFFVVQTSNVQTLSSTRRYYYSLGLACSRHWTCPKASLHPSFQKIGNSGALWHFSSDLILIYSTFNKARLLKHFYISLLPCNLNPQTHQFFVYIPVSCLFTIYSICFHLGLDCLWICKTSPEKSSIISEKRAEDHSSC